MRFFRFFQKFSIPAMALLSCLVASVCFAANEKIDLRALASWQGREVTELILEGMPADLEAVALKGLALTPRRKLLKRKRANLTLKLGKADANRICLLLAKNGFPDTRVTARCEADGEDGVKVTFQVDAGSEVLFGTIELQGAPPHLAGDLAQVVGELAPGTRIIEKQVVQTRSALLAALKNAGYAQPEVNFTLTRHPGSLADLVFRCSPGKTFRYQDFLIQGAPDDLIPLVRRTVDLQPGTPFSPGVASDARKHLRKLQLFRQVRLKSDARDSTTLNLIADLQVRRMITANASFGSFTDNWYILRAGIVHRNFFHRGIGAGTGASYGAHVQEIFGRVFWHSRLFKRSRSELRLSYEIQDEDSYRLEKSGIEFSTLLESWDFSSLRFGVAVSNGNLENRSADSDAFAEDVGTQTVFMGTWYRDTSDSPLDPHKGHRLTLRTDVSPPGFWTDSPFFSAQAMGARYFALGEKSVFAARLDGGIAWPLGDAENLSPDRRWFAGGVSTMRGYRRKMLGPLDSEANPIGGQLRFLASGELRLPVWSFIGVAFFVDAGQVWAEHGQFDLSDLAVAAGAGLMIGTPIGPVRLDLAHNLTGNGPVLPNTVFQLGIGHPF